MLSNVTCPKCQCVFPVTEARQPIGIECPKCDAELTAEFLAIPGQRSLQLQVTVGHPASRTTFAFLAGKRKPTPARKRIEQINQNSMLGVMVVSLIALFISIGGLGATGYYLFNNVDGRVANRAPTTQARIPVTPTPTPQTTEPVESSPLPRQSTFELKPLLGPLPPITPPELAGDSTIDLDPLGGRVGAISVGGGGRYIVMHFPDKGMLNVFDVSEGKFLGGIETDKGDVKMVAGLSWVITSMSGSNLRVFTLPNLQWRYDVSIDLFSGISAMALGNRTDGPLLVSNSFGDVVLYNIGTANLKEIEGARKKPGIVATNLRASPDGTAFLSYSITFEPPQTRIAKVLTESNRDWAVTNLDAAVTIPGPDGNFYGSSSPLDRLGQQLPMTAKMAVMPGRTWFIPQITKAGDVPLTQQGYLVRVLTSMRLVQPPVQVAPVQPALPVPAPAPQLPTADVATTKPVDQPVAQPVQPIRQYKPTLIVSIHTGANTVAIVPNTQMIAALPEFDGLFDANGLPKPILDQHFFLVPEAKLLVILSGDRMKLLLRKLNLP